jgi:hypothetical protein
MAIKPAAPMTQAACTRRAQSFLHAAAIAGAAAGKKRCQLTRQCRLPAPPALPPAAATVPWPPTAVALRQVPAAAVATKNVAALVIALLLCSASIMATEAPPVMPIASIPAARQQQLTLSHVLWLGSRLRERESTLLCSRFRGSPPRLSVPQLLKPPVARRTLRRGRVLLLASVNDMDLQGPNHAVGGSCYDAC